MDGGLFSEEYCYNRPTLCEKCGASLEYKGIGEYRCPDCSQLYYDDYGTVRNYLEHHNGATQAQVAEATGVSMNTIRQFLRNQRLEITANSSVFLHCEGCGAAIRLGRFCEKCQNNRARVARESISRSSNIQGYGIAKSGDSGAKRFTGRS